MNLRSADHSTLVMHKSADGLTMQISKLSASPHAVNSTHLRKVANALLSVVGDLKDCDLATLAHSVTDKVTQVHNSSYNPSLSHQDISDVETDADSEDERKISRPRFQGRDFVATKLSHLARAIVALHELIYLIDVDASDATYLSLLDLHDDITVRSSTI